MQTLASEFYNFWKLLIKHISKTNSYEKNSPVINGHATDDVGIAACFVRKAKKLPTRSSQPKAKAIHADGYSGYVNSLLKK
jgi:hypothetical protein